MGSNTDLLDLQSELAAMDMGLPAENSGMVGGAVPPQQGFSPDPTLDRILLGPADEWIVTSPPPGPDNSSFTMPAASAFAQPISQQQGRQYMFQQTTQVHLAELQGHDSGEFISQIQQLVQPEAQTAPLQPPHQMQLPPRPPPQVHVVALPQRLEQFPTDLPSVMQQYQHPQSSLPTLPPTAAPLPQPGQFYDPLAHIPPEVKARMWAQMQAELAKDAAEIPATNRQRQLSIDDDRTPSEDTSGGFGLGIPDKYAPLSPSTLEWEQNRPWAKLPNAAALVAAQENSADVDPAAKRKRADRPRGSASGESNVINDHGLGEVDQMDSFIAELGGAEAQADEAAGKLPKPEGVVKCPRCQSDNTKFCYYNNKNIKQPRYLCKGCNKYWTAGGLLRKEKSKDGKGSGRALMEAGNGSA